MRVRCPVCGKPHIEIPSVGEYNQQTVEFECDAIEGVTCVTYFEWRKDKWVISSMCIPAAAFYKAQNALGSLIGKEAEVVEMCAGCNEKEATCSRNDVRLCKECKSQLIMQEIKQHSGVITDGQKKSDYIVPKKMR